MGNLINGASTKPLVDYICISNCDAFFGGSHKHMEFKKGNIYSLKQTIAIWYRYNVYIGDDDFIKKYFQKAEDNIMYQVDTLFDKFFNNG